MIDEESQWPARLRLDLLQGIDRALQRYPELLAAITAARNSTDARAAVGDLLGIDRNQATAALGLRWDGR